MKTDKKIYCGYSGCRRQIKDATMNYVPAENKFYHLSGCRLAASTAEVFKTGESKIT